ncbi:hypothetical protein KIH86_25340 [Paenibacillus sp. HN-1]|uniref:hypothetical protein n=1 Tax=Paenibacillus TaxID=44249 RepID=UPI001CA96841|nr:MULTISPECIES: hypothetical protein [Paenibacillus]MBY9082621.1 hypothetical protein [Paenibacillus sp. CGMCC 1.18879]MBY9087516.1 hypothetical protein [Paenibacillus sinensis]
MDFSGVKIPFSVNDSLIVAFDFLTIYRDWVLLSIGIILGLIICWMLFHLMDKSKKSASTSAGRSKAGNQRSSRSSGSGVRGSKYDAQGYHKRTRGRGAFTDEERLKLDREMYDYLTKTGRIKERNDWVRNTKKAYLMKS